MKTEYIYGLYDPRDNSLRYVGMTNNLDLRYRGHVRDDRENNKRKSEWMSELKSMNLLPIMKVIETCDSGNASEREKYWIAYYRENHIKLFNLSKGGDKGPGFDPKWHWEISLDWDKVRQIREILSTTNRSMQSVGDEFKVHVSTINKIAQNRLWIDANFSPINRGKHRFHILVQKDADEIRSLYNTGEYGRDDLMKMFDSSANVIQEIINNTRFTDSSYVRINHKISKLRRFSTKEVDKIKDLINSGKTYKFICENFGVDFKTLKRAIS